MVWSTCNRYLNSPSKGSGPHLDAAVSVCVESGFHPSQTLSSKGEQKNTNNSSQLKGSLDNACVSFFFLFLFLWEEGYKSALDSMPPFTDSTSWGCSNQITPDNSLPTFENKNID